MICPSCKKEVDVKISLYNPDDPDSFYIYECTECYESIDIVEINK